MTEFDPEFADALEAAGFSIEEWEEMGMRVTQDEYDLDAKKQFDKYCKIIEDELNELR